MYSFHKMQLLQSNIDTFTSFPLLGYTVSSTVHSVHHHAICCCPSGRRRIAALMLSSSSLFLVRVFNLFRPAAASHPRLTPTRPPFRLAVSSRRQTSSAERNKTVDYTIGRDDRTTSITSPQPSGAVQATVIAVRPGHRGLATQ